MPAGDAPAECAPVHRGGELPLPVLQLPAGGLLKITNLMILLSLYCSGVCGKYRGGELILPLLIIPGGGLLETLMILSHY